MKKIFWIISFFGFSLALGMEELPDLKTMQNYINEANAAISKGEKDKGLALYGKIANISFPSGNPAYAEQRKLRQKAVTFIYSEIEKLTNQAEYEEALKIYSYAPRTFSNQIEALQKIIPFQEQIQQAIQFKKFEDIYKIFDRAELKDIPENEHWKLQIKEQEKDYYYNEAQNAKSQNNREKEFEWLGKIVEMFLPHTREYRWLRDFRSNVMLRMQSETSNLKNLGKYKEALEVYRSAPQAFAFEIKQMGLTERFQQAMDLKKYDEALKILGSPELYYSEIQKLKPSIEIQYYLQKARELGEDKEAWKWYAQATKVPLPDAPSSGIDPYKDVRLLKKEAINKIFEVVTNLKNQGLYDEVLKLYNSAPQAFANEIQALQKYLPLQKEIQKAILLANERKFEDALKALDDQKLESIKNSPEIAKLKMDFRNEKLKLEQAAPEQKTWIFLRSINEPENLEPSDWHIIGTPPDARLELNAEAVDPITTEKFVELIEEAQKEKRPYILLGLRNSDGFYHLVDDSYLPALLKNWKNPVRGIIDVVEIFVAGDDGKLTFLKEMKKGDEMFTFIYLAQEKLRKSGEGHLVIANLFKQKADKLSGKEQQIALQYARQWYNWAMKYLSPGSFEYTQAKNEFDKIPYKPEILTKEQQPEVPGSLMQALQNLTRSLRYVEAKLY